MSKSSFIKDYSRLFRVGNLLFIILIQYLTLFCIFFTFFPNPELIFHATLPSGISFNNAFLLLVLSTTLIAAAGNIINDVYDVDTDSINRPTKTIVGNKISKGVAVGTAIILGIIGSVLGFLMSIKIDFWATGFIFPLCALGLWFYASIYKKTLLTGNIIISLFCAIAILIVWFFTFLMIIRTGTVGECMSYNAKYINVFAIGFALFAFLTTLIREIIKDCEDINGDTFIGCKTIPIVYGFEKTKNVLFWLTFSLIAILAVAQWFLLKSNWSLMGYWGFVIQLLLLRFASNLQSADSKEDFHKLSKKMKIIMFLGVISMVLIPISLLIHPF